MSKANNMSGKPSRRSSRSSSRPSSSFSHSSPSKSPFKSSRNFGRNKNTNTNNTNTTNTQKNHKKNQEDYFENNNASRFKNNSHVKKKKGEDQYEEVDEEPQKTSETNFFFKRYKSYDAGFLPKKPIENYLRINTLLKSENEVVWQLTKLGIKLTKTPLPLCYKYESSFALSSTTEHLNGWFYLQGLASQCVAHALNPQKDWTIIDMAAAPGSKTTHLAQLMHNTGRIIAIDKSNDRLQALRDNCERLGVTNVITIRKDARFALDLGIKADAILLDAPCSGNYCSESNWLEKRNLPDIQTNARMQKELLKTASKLLKLQGVLIYSTCSLEPEEDELLLQNAKELGLEFEAIMLPDMNQSAGLVVIENETLDPKTALAQRFWPYKTGTEGFFVARLRKIS